MRQDAEPSLANMTCDVQSMTSPSVVDAGPAIRRLFGPSLDLSSFLCDYYEQRVLHVARDDAQYFARVYSVAEFERGLFVASRFADRAIRLARRERPPPSLADLRAEDSRSRKHGQRTRPDQQTSRPIDLRKLAECYAEGCTLILNEAFALTPSLGAFCSALERELGFTVRANAYFTPPGAQGFELHHDTHDTIILQIEGAKSWNVHSPRRTLPLEHETELPKANDPAPSARDVTLLPGDTLYLPRGTPHEARTASARSLHVTLGWYPPRLCDLVVRAIQNVARDDESLRAGVRPGWHRDASVADRVRTVMRTACDSLADDGRLRLALEGAASDAVLDGLDEPIGHFDAVDGVEALSEASVLQLRSDVALQFCDRLFSIELTIPGRSLSLPASYAASVERLQAGATALRDLDPDLPLDDRKALARRLVVVGAAHILSNVVP